jgi:two-component system sensor histidine kinase ChvG
MAETFRHLLALWQSFAAKLALLLVIFVAVPIVLYGQFHAADADKNTLLYRSVQEEGRLIAESLRPMLESFQAKSAVKLGDVLARIGGERINVKLLFRPAGVVGPNSFFYMAASPPLSTDYLEKEREDLLNAGILEKLRDTCEGNRPLAVRYTNPAGAEEILTSITPTNLKSGCWIVITSHATEEFVSSSIGQPYWKTPEVRLAAAIYLLLAVIVLSLFLDIWRSLRRFEKLARAIRTERVEGQSFQALNRIPELDRVAEEFDRLVHALRESAQSIHQAAEENAHALKAPLAVIAQSIEPLKRTVGTSDGRGQRAVELIERSVARLDALVSAARRMEQTTAELIDPPHQLVDLSALIKGMLDAYRDTMAARGLMLRAEIQPDIGALGSEDLFEGVIENLLENAISFSPANGEIVVTLSARGSAVVLTVEDQGPGVPHIYLDRIFERYFSHRPVPSADEQPGQSRSNFGIGLWIVHRNVEAVGGCVAARNKEAGGLLVTVTLPAVSRSG